MESESNPAFYLVLSPISKEEKILFAIDVGDRRHRIISSVDKRIITRCTLRLVTENDGCGTATAFYYDHKHKTVWVITCAHNVVNKINSGKQRKISKVPHVYLERRDTLKNGGSELIHRYKSLGIYYHPKYSFTSRDPYDLAILKFKDDTYYENLSQRNKGNPTLLPFIPFESINIECLEVNKLEIIGYPAKSNKYSKADKNGEELLGMKGGENNIYNFRNYIEEEKGVIYHNVCDTECGNSGSAMIYTDNDKCGILGVHTGGDRNIKVEKNWGITLDTIKLKWIRSMIPSYKEDWEEVQLQHDKVKPIVDDWIIIPWYTDI